MSVRTRLIAVAVALVVVAAAIVVVVLLMQPREATAPDASTPPAPPATSAPSPEPYSAPSAVDLGALPAAAATMEYVIGGLMPFNDGPIVDRVYHLAADAPVYGEDRTAAPVARLDAVNFLREATVVVVSRFDGDWALVLTPARIALPSASQGTAPAQSAGWIRRDLLVESHAQTHRVIVDIAQRTATIQTWTGDTVETYPVGVGGLDNPSPTGTTYIQARYLDPAQDQTVHRIQLTGAYSSESDAPWRGSAHTGLHFSPDPASDSHGCVRLTAEGIEAIDALPIGTVVTFIDEANPADE